MRFHKDEDERKQDKTKGDEQTFYSLYFLLLVFEVSTQAENYCYFGQFRRLERENAKADPSVSSLSVLFKNENQDEKGEAKEIERVSIFD